MSRKVTITREYFTNRKLPLDEVVNDEGHTLEDFYKRIESIPVENQQRVINILNNKTNKEMLDFAGFTLKF